MFVNFLHHFPGGVKIKNIFANHHRVFASVKSDYLFFIGGGFSKPSKGGLETLRFDQVTHGEVTILLQRDLHLDDLMLQLAKSIAVPDMKRGFCSFWRSNC